MGSSVVDRVRNVLAFSQEGVLVVAVVHRRYRRTAISKLCPLFHRLRDREGMSSRILLRPLTVWVGRLFSRDSLGVGQRLFSFRVLEGRGVFPMPYRALVIATATYLNERRFRDVQGERCLPKYVVGACNFHTFCISAVGTPSKVRVVCCSSTAKWESRSNCENFRLDLYRRERRTRGWGGRFLRGCCAV